MDNLFSTLRSPFSAVFDMHQIFRKSDSLTLDNGQSYNTADLIYFVLEASFTIAGKHVLCSDIVPGVTMVSLCDERTSLDNAHKLHLIDDIWTWLRKELIDWLTSPTVTPQINLQYNPRIKFQLYWNQKMLPLPMDFNIYIHFDPSYITQYSARRRNKPLQECPLDNEAAQRQRFVILRRLFLEAREKSRLTFDDKYSHLPLPMRFRAAGAQNAWQAFREQSAHVLPKPSLATELSSASMMTILKKFYTLAQTLLCFSTKEHAIERLAAEDAQSAILQAFELREGVIYEPTGAAHSLLNTAYIAETVPISMLQLPSDTLCILPWRGNLDGGGNDEAIVVFGSKDEVSFATWSNGNSGLKFRTFRLPLSRPDTSLREAIDQAWEHTTVVDIFDVSNVLPIHTQKPGLATLNYAIKLLLYLKTPDAQISHYCTAIPKDLSMHHKCTNAEQPEEINPTYNRSSVDSTIVGEYLSELPPLSCTHDRVTSLLKGTCFKMQRHGPRAALRKLMLLIPSIRNRR
ncbi:hypothetical protein [Pseudomonas protegens]|jgi:hypothetical protein|uniref:hypothetical protein n=1 Tax=Pseudomonas protegens TaxID=380021 RepID=UPI003EBB4F2C